MVEIFKTNVHREDQASTMLNALMDAFPAIKINFDLEDCDRILKVEGNNINPQRIIHLLNTNGYTCAILPDETIKI